ncbi:MAG: hypothetical protein WCP16_10755 [Pseudanabaena sp. ELA645]|jgi:hypothetical protein
MAIKPLDDLEREHLLDSLAWVDSAIPSCKTSYTAKAFGILFCDH